MKPTKEGCRIAVVGASTLLGKELINVLEEHSFPVSRLVTFEADEEEPNLPIVDLREGFEAAIEDQDVREAELDFAFLAAPLREGEETPSFLRSTNDSRMGALADQGRHCVTIDLTGEAFDRIPETRDDDRPQRVVSVPFLDRTSPIPSAAIGNATHYVSAHPAVIVISTLLVRLAARFPVRSVVAHLFGSASEMGSHAIDELQKQTVNLLSFQKIPRQVFGAQLAFNLLPRLGRGGSRELGGIEQRIRQQLHEYLANRVPVPAVRLFQVPVFHSVGVSLYVETADPVSPEAANAALAGERIQLPHASQEVPSQVEAAGSSEILVDTIAADPEHPTGLWLWGVADNLRLAAVNAVEIAESLREHVRS
jgi:aspartate-semialdehyde dehydrogenase